MHVMIGYDGSPAAANAIGCAASLLPQATASVTYLWTPPFASDALRRRLWHGERHVDDFVAAIEREGAAEADRLAAMGVVLAEAAGWVAEPLVERSCGGEGLQFAEVAGKLDPDLIVVGSRGVGGARAVLGSVSDVAVYCAPRPIMVVPHPMLTTERAALAAGPVLVGWDGSAGASRAVKSAEELFGGRRIILATVADGAVTEQPPDGRDLPAAAASGQHETGRAVAEALHRLAAEKRAAAVVVGSRGRSAFREILLGSVAMAVVHRASRPVVVMPHETEDMKPGRGGWP